MIEGHIKCHALHRQAADGLQPDAVDAVDEVLLAAVDHEPLVVRVIGLAAAAADELRGRAPRGELGYEHEHLALVGAERCIQEIERMRQALFRMRDAGRGNCILVISHQERILRIADEIVLLSRGGIEASGPRDEMLPGIIGTEAAVSACGRLEGFYEGHLKIWDYAAGKLLVEEAGGIVLADKERVFASAPGIAEEFRCIAEEEEKDI